MDVFKEFNSLPEDVRGGSISLLKGTGSGSHHQKQVEVLIVRTKKRSPSIKLLYITEKKLSLNS